MKRTSFRDWQCSIARTLDVVGEWWTPLVLREVFFGTHRFDDILDHLGVARNILADRLRTLVEHGVLEKIAYQDNPPRFEYHLTAKGRDLYPVLVALLDWGDTWEFGGATPPVELEHVGCGRRTRARMVCGECGEPLDSKGGVRFHRNADTSSPRR